MPGLPCEVTALLQTHCWACHGATPSGGASFSLMTIDQLKAPSGKDPSLSYAQRSVIRMQASSSPMPPSPATPVPASDIAAFDAWVKAGLPETGCNPGGAAGAAGAGGAEGGAGSAGSAGGVVDPYNTPLMCTSTQQWTGGDSESELMHPGVACKTCHALGGKAGFKTFDVAGTVYPSAHEPNDCNGVSVAGAKVIIIDAKNQEHPLDVNAAGNFYHLDLVGFGAWPPPYRARVEYNGKKREMVGPQMSGDCNSCHNETGTNNAPGRIMLP